MDKAHQFRKNILEGFVKAIEREVALVEEELSRLKSEDFKDAETRTSYMELMGEVHKAKQMSEMYKEVKELEKATPTSKSDDGKPSFGFVPLKEAA